MTLPSPRKIVVDGQSYDYVYSGSKGPLLGNSYAVVRLTVDLKNKKYLQVHMVSSEYIERDDYEKENVQHKVAFTPKHVRFVLENYLNKGSAPINQEFDGWICHEIEGRHCRKDDG